MMLLKWISNWLFPEKCILCERILEREEMDLCRNCRVHAPECPISKLKYPYIDRWTALWYYEADVRKSLLRYKFHNRRSYAAGYGRMLAMKLLREERLDFDILTWVPISRQRRHKRGFDQVELLAQRVGEELEMTPLRTLEKIRHNKQQSGIFGQAQRKANVLGAYQAVEPANFFDKRVLLLDDILTTGATASECAKVLLTAGAKEVQIAVIAMANHQNNSDR